jgi:hypothetical protein
MNRFRITFASRDGTFEKSFNISAQDEAMAWNWAEKQKEGWRASMALDTDPKKLKVTIAPVDQKPADKKPSK